MGTVLSSDALSGATVVLFPAMARAAVYIDGFNLYYGALKGTPYKWLDVEALARKLAPTDQLVAVRYFTARVRPQPNDPQQP